MKKRLGLLKWDCFKCSTQQCKGSLTPQHAGTIISSDSCQLLSLRQSSHFSFKTRTPGLTLFFLHGRTPPPRAGRQPTAVPFPSPAPAPHEALSRREWGWQAKASCLCSSAPILLGIWSHGLEPLGLRWLQSRCWCCCYQQNSCILGLYEVRTIFFFW